MAIMIVVQRGSRSCKRPGAASTPEQPLDHDPDADQLMASVELALQTTGRVATICLQ